MASLAFDTSACCCARLAGPYGRSIQSDAGKGEAWQRFGTADVIANDIRRIGTRADTCLALIHRNGALVVTLTSDRQTQIRH